MPRVDDQQRSRIRDDLKGILRGELLFDDLSRNLYSTDASIFQVRPLGAVAPLDEDDLRALVRYAFENDVPLMARGAGTGVAGESLGFGLMVDLSKHFRQIVEVGERTVRVQPGVTLRALNERLARIGRRFAPDPASTVCTLGGMLATNASGSHVLRHGYTADHVEAIRIVLDTGDAASLGPLPWPLPVDTPADHLRDIVDALGVLLEQHQSTANHHRPRTPFSRSGYRLDILREGKLDLVRLLVGSEGTLALFTEATLRTLPIPRGRSVVLLGFASLDGALKSAQQILPSGPAACELLDRRLLNLARAGEGSKVSGLISPNVEAVLLVEFEGDSPAEVQSAARLLSDSMQRADSLAISSIAAHEPEDLEQLWRLRDTALPTLFGVKGGAQPVPFVEDVGVPIDALPEYFRRVQEILREHDVTASYLAHACSGQVHTRPFLDLNDPSDVSKLGQLAEKIHGLAIDLGGTISTQHGTGIARTPWIARQAGPLLPLYRQVKAIFDPKNLLNPGKIVDPDPDFSPWPLRTLARPADKIELNLLWTPEQVGRESQHCNGCGQCRSESPRERMCPIFRANPNEAATPRAKANLLRNVLSDPKLYSSDEVRGIADLCVHCKMCQVECPSHVNIPKLMAEAKAAHVAEHGLDRAAWFVSRLEMLTRLGSTFKAATNFILGSSTMRWLLEKTLGLSSRRRLHRLAATPFLTLARRRGMMKTPEPGHNAVALFVDYFPNFFDPSIAEAAVTVLRHNGFDVFVPPGQTSNGMAPLAQGDVETARDVSQRNLRALAEAARAGIPILCIEPTAALMFRQDLLDLIDEPDSRALSRQAIDLTTFLWKLHQEGKLKTDFLPLPFKVGHHVPCHVKALGAAASPHLLKLVPELKLHTIDVGCSGMAGTYGLRRKNYRASLATGKPMLEQLARPDVMVGSTECSSCRLQMEDAGKKRTLHPVQYLALAYGQMPELANYLKQPIRDLVL